MNMIPPDPIRLVFDRLENLKQKMPYYLVVNIGYLKVEMDYYKHYKIVVVGDGGVGKSTFLKRHRTGEFENKYLPTMGVDVIPLQLHTNYGLIIFKIWDCAGQEKFGGLREGYYQAAEGAIVMFDLGSGLTGRNVIPWIHNVRSVVPNIPVIICGNKCDLRARKITGRIEAQDLPGVKYYEISARSNYNFEKPFLQLARELTGHQDLEFVEMPPICPPKVKVHSNSRQTDSPSPPEVQSNSPQTDSPSPQNKVHCHWTEIPGGMMKVTYEFYPCVKEW